ncbi:MAG: glycosyltransferase family 39 protein [Candidatus Liptonbacteria bacterium]|nr:glycosyltransferase family 39 protein [Candidatus Liptonbacteria bacterium]
MHSESEATQVLRKLAISREGCGYFPVPLRCGSVGVAMATPPSPRLADTGKSLATRVGSIFEIGSSFGAAWVLILICITSFSFMLWGAFHDAAITDEVAHIPSGYGYVHNFDYRLNPEHPPLVKALAAFPLLFINPDFPTNDPAWTTDVNGQWVMGGKFLYGSPANDATEIVRLARIAPILLTILLIVLIYFWSRKLMGDWWGLVPAFLFALSPTIIAHGHYVTTDIGAAFGIVLATYCFMRFLHHPSRHNLLYAGLAFGVAEITKFSAVLLVPYFIVLIIIFYAASAMRDWNQTEASDRRKRFAIRAWRYAKSVIIIFFIGYALIVYPVYAIFTANYPVAKQVSDTTDILKTFAGGPTPAGTRCVFMRCVANLNIGMAGNALTRPLAHYMLGVLMVLQRADGGNTNYFLGTVSNRGSRLYFPIVYLLKEPLPVLIMIFVGIFLVLRNIVKKIKDRGSRIKENALNYLSLNFTEFSLFLFIVLYWAWSMKSPLNIGVRHLITTIPFIYMLTAGVWKRWVTKIDWDRAAPAADMLKNGMRQLARVSLKYIFLVLLLVWSAGATAFAAPYFLSYFNELGGGTSGGYRYVTDSNYDWGQDLLELQSWLGKHAEIDKIAVDYFGGGNAHYYLGDKEIDWWSAKGNPSTSFPRSDSGQAGQAQPIHWLAVSINSLEGQTQPLVGDLTRNQVDEYRWLTELRPPLPGMGNVPAPDYRVGTTLFVYKL